jgi:hypothetical protein
MKREGFLFENEVRVALISDTANPAKTLEVAGFTLANTKVLLDPYLEVWQAKEIRMLLGLVGVAHPIKRSKFDADLI